MIFGQNFYNIESMTAKELDELLTSLKSLLNSGKITSNLPNNTISELNKINSSIKDIQSLMDKKLEKYVLLTDLTETLTKLTENLQTIDGGTYNN